MKERISLRFSSVFDRELMTGDYEDDTLEVRIAGISFRVNHENYEDYTLEGGYVEHDINNEHDPNAIGIYHEDGNLIGYVPRQDIDIVNEFINGQKAPCMLYIAPFIDNEGESGIKGLARIFRYYDGENAYINDAMDYFSTYYYNKLKEDIKECTDKLKKQIRQINQTNEDNDYDSHLMFKNIPLGGQVSVFKEKLCNEGYNYHDDYLSGIFAGHKAKIYVVSDEYTDLVSSVIVQFKEEQTWESLKGMFLKMRELYIKKYGEPTEDNQFFLSPYSEGDGDELEATELRSCAYMDVFEVPNGKITICIMNKKVVILYNDAAFIDSEDDYDDDFEEEFYEDYDDIDDI